MFRLIVFAAAVSCAAVSTAFASELVITANFTEPSDLQQFPKLPVGPPARDGRFTYIGD